MQRAPNRRNAGQGRRLDSLCFDNSFRRLPAELYARTLPTPLPGPYTIAASAEAAALLDLDVRELARPSFARVFSGNQVLPGSEPLSAVYGGHQFGQWAGQLGDGRAHLLGEVVGVQGSFELQLKGSGPTPYARDGDGRAILSSSIREFLCSEAMAALGVPTTRALSVVGSDAPVQRRTTETAAVVTRLAPSFVRFGSFEHWSKRGRHDLLQRLADYVVDHFYPALREASAPHLALLCEVARRTGELVAHWQAVGFMHGVMNTDNMSILGLTLDYGPFGFMERFNAGQICNRSDHAGRYLYRGQPRVAEWNVSALAQALAPLLGAPQVGHDAAEEAFRTGFSTTFCARMRSKLGLRSARPTDDALIADTFALLQRARVDYTSFFRRLSRLPAVAGDTPGEAPVRALFPEPEQVDAWLLAYRARLSDEASIDAERTPRMLAENPKYILRNWMAESAIRRAKQHEFSEVQALLRCLQTPHAEHPACAHYAEPAPDWAEGLYVSCAS